MRMGIDGLPVRQHNWSADARRGVPLDAAAIDAEMDELAEMVRTLWARHNALEAVTMRGGSGAPAAALVTQAAVPHEVIRQAVAAAVAPLRTELVAQSRAPATVVSAGPSGPDPAAVARVEALERALAAVSRAPAASAVPDQTTINRLTALEAALAAVRHAVAASPVPAAAAVNLTPITDRLTALERGLAAAAEASLSIARDVIVRQRLLLEARAALDDGDPDGSNYPLLEVYAAGRRIHDAAEQLFAAQAAWSVLAAASSDPAAVVKAWREAV